MMSTRKMKWLGTKAMGGRGSDLDQGDSVKRIKGETPKKT